MYVTFLQTYILVFILVHVTLLFMHICLLNVLQIRPGMLTGIP